MKRAFMTFGNPFGLWWEQWKIDAAAESERLWRQIHHDETGGNTLAPAVIAAEIQSP